MTTPAKRILVVDDDPDVRRVTCLLLRQGGYQLLEAGSGAQALDLLANSAEVVLLITDLRMPEMSGEELARQALALRPHLRVLFVTGFSSDAVAAAALAPDRTAVVEKPYSLPHLLARVKEALGE